MKNWPGKVENLENLCEEAHRLWKETSISA